MRLWHLLLSLYFPLCATIGITGITPPGVVDFSHYHPKYSWILVAPSGASLAPDILAPVYKVAPATLFAALQTIAAAEPRTYQLDIEPAQLQAAWVVRSALSNFPDIVQIAVVPEGTNKSSFIFTSHALYGWYAYGVNNHRARNWLNQLNQKVPQ